MHMFQFNLLLAGLAIPKARPSTGGSISDYTPMIVVGILCIGLFWLVLHNWDRLFKQINPKKSNENTLFSELCTTHQMSNTEKTTLRNAAASLKLTEPALLFVEPQWLDKLAQKSDEWKKPSERLKFKLFG